MADNAKVLQDGLAFANQAVQQDTKGNAKEATQLYKQALQCLERALIIEKDAQRKQIISQKITEYKNRTEQLREQTKKQEVTDRVAKLGVGTLPSLMNNNNTNSPSTSRKESYSSPPVPEPSFVPNNPPPPSYSASLASPSLSSYTSPIPTNVPVPNFQNIPTYTPIPIPATPPQSENTKVLQAMPDFPPPNLMSKNEALQAGITLCDKGKEEDDKNRYANALSLYKKGLDYLAYAMKDEINPDTKKKIADKMKYHLVRAEQITTSMQYSQTATENGGMYQPKLCALCKLEINVTDPYKIYQELAYHPKCVDQVIGTEREDTKYIMGLSGREPITLKVVIAKRQFFPGELTSLSIVINNQTSKKVTALIVYVLKIETRMEVVQTPDGYERKARTRQAKVGRQNYHGISSQFEKTHNIITLNKEDVRFAIPDGLELSELAGATASFVREYELCIKAKLPKPFGALKIRFPIILSKK